jgi:hypothetical protein
VHGKWRTRTWGKKDGNAVVPLPLPFLAPFLRPKRWKIPVITTPSSCCCCCFFLASFHWGLSLSVSLSLWLACLLLQCLWILAMWRWSQSIVVVVQASLLAAVNITSTVAKCWGSRSPWTPRLPPHPSTTSSHFPIWNGISQLLASKDDRGN